MALKLSDLGHLSAPLKVHLRWVAALEEEFFRQGDAEKACNIPVSPLFDRTLPGVTKSQVNVKDSTGQFCSETAGWDDDLMIFVNMFLGLRSNDIFGAKQKGKKKSMDTVLK